MKLESNQTIDAYTRRDVLKVASLSSIAYLLHAVGCQSRDAVAPRSTAVEQDAHKREEVPIELKDEKLLDHGVIRVGIRSNAEEKERIRGSIKRALRIVLADPDLAEAYGNSKTVEHLVVPDISETLKQIITTAPEQFQHVDIDREISQSAHGDAYTVAVETVSLEGKLLAVQNFILMREPLILPENFPQLVVTLDHECRHILLRGQRLPRREEEILVYSAGIERMEQVARTLQQRGGEDAELGQRIITEALPVHQKRLGTWEYQR